MAYRLLTRMGYLALCLLAATSVLAQTDANTATVYQTVNVRTGPDTRFDIVGQLTEGDSVTIDGLDKPAGRWVRVRLNDGLVGWVPTFVLIVETDLAALPVIADETPDDESIEDVTITVYGRVNVRSGPGIAYEIVAQLDADDVVQVSARSNTNNDWLYIQSETVTGWVAYFTVRIDGAVDSLPVLVPDATGEQLVEPDIFITTRFNARLHTEPTLDSPDPYIVSFGEQVQPLAQSADGEWLYVAYDDFVGWAVVSLFVIEPEQVELLPVYVPEEATPEATDSLVSTPAP